MRIDAASAECVVRTFKEGLLSAVAHDLEIAVTAFTIDVDERAWRVDARFDARSLRVVDACREGMLAPGTLSQADKRAIEGHIVRDVLDADRDPEIRFSSTRATGDGDALLIDGTLALHGRERSVVVTARRDGGRWIAETRLHQPDFGITPYHAMLGTLRVGADVVVRVTVATGS
jgi:hypothetical protein